MLYKLLRLRLAVRKFHTMMEKAFDQMKKAPAPEISTEELIVR